MVSFVIFFLSTFFQRHNETTHAGGDKDLVREAVQVHRGECQDANRQGRRGLLLQVYAFLLFVRNFIWAFYYLLGT